MGMKPPHPTNRNFKGTSRQPRKLTQLERQSKKNGRQPQKKMKMEDDLILIVEKLEWRP
jgi:hypothetical protein